MERAGLAQQIRPNIVTQAESCEKTAQLVALGTVDTVLGWRVFQYWDPDKIETVLLPPERVSRIGYIPIAMTRYVADRELAQDLALFPHLSVRDNILFPTRARGGVPGSGPRMQALAGTLGIEHVLGRRDVRSLSGGEAQRVALARALIVPPKVLFLDECFASLDTPLRRRLVGELHSLRHELGLTVVMVTHDQEEACILADEVAVLEAGRILQAASPSDLYARPFNERVARFLGMENILGVDRVEQRGERRFCSFGSLEIEVPADGPLPAQITFFAEDVQLVDGAVSPAAGARSNVLSGRVRDVLCMGQRALLGVLPEAVGPATMKLLVSVRADETCRWEPGYFLRFHVLKERIRCLPKQTA